MKEKNVLTEELNELIGEDKAEKLSKAFQKLKIPKINIRDSRLAKMHLMDLLEDYYSGVMTVNEIIKDNDLSAAQGKLLRGWITYSGPLYIKSVYDLFYALTMFPERIHETLDPIVNIIGTSAAAVLIEYYGGCTLNLREYNKNQERNENNVERHPDDCYR